MLSLLRRHATSQVARNARWFSEAVPASRVATASTSRAPTQLPTSTPESSSSRPEKLPYFIPRNTRGNLPVYSDFKNQGTRQLVHIRNIEGNIDALVKELRANLFPASSHEAKKIKVQQNHMKHIVITGGRWRDHVFEWLKAKGF